MNKTSIEWTDYTWNPVTGCDKVSAGCRSCYAETLAKRFWGTRKFTDVQMHDDRLNEPTEMKNKLIGKKVFVCDVSDLFHESVSFEFIVQVFRQIYYHPQTIFQILTKRPKRMLEYFEWAKKWLYWNGENIWIGVSCEDQKAADERIPYLLQIPAAVRFLSCEPLIGPIDLRPYFDCPSCEGFGFRNDGDENINDGYYDCIRCEGTGNRNEIHWVIAGGESGGFMARPCNPDWVRALRDECDAYSVPFFFKQWGEYISHTQAFDGQITEGKKPRVVDGHAYFRIGKSKTGNLLDGVQHLNFPKLPTANCQLLTSK